MAKVSEKRLGEIMLQDFRRETERRKEALLYYNIITLYYHTTILLYYNSAGHPARDGAAE